MDWTYQSKLFTPTLVPKVDVGFVYLITNRVNGKMYVGKKRFFFKGWKKVNKKKKRVMAESDWKTYYGSSGAVVADLHTHGEENFSREILHLCSSLSECNYLEAKEQFLRDVLLSPKYYNDWISVRCTRKHLRRLQTL